MGWREGCAILLFCLAIPLIAFGSLPGPDVQNIVERSVTATNRDWEAAPRYDFTEQDREDTTTKTFRVLMIYGSPYKNLIAVNGKPLTGTQSARERQKLAATIAQRQAESRRRTARRLAAYLADRQQDHLMMSQLTQAFSFALQGQQQLGSREVYVLKAIPRPGYRPPNMESRALIGMEGTLWVDKETFQWVKVEAHVVRPVSIGGILARVEPGTLFQLENAPVSGDIWLPTHFSMRSHATVLLAFSHNTQDDETYSDYHVTPEYTQAR